MKNTLLVIAVLLTGSCATNKENQELKRRLEAAVEWNEQLLGENRMFQRVLKEALQESYERHLKNKDTAALRDSVIGEFSVKKGENTLKLIFLENGVAEVYNNGNKDEKEYEWKIVDGETHVEDEDGNVGVYKINKLGRLILIAEIDKDGKRKDIQKEEQPTLKKIK